VLCLWVDWVLFVSFMIAVLLVVLVFTSLLSSAVRYCLCWTDISYDCCLVHMQ